MIGNPYYDVLCYCEKCGASRPCTVTVEGKHLAHYRCPANHYWRGGCIYNFRPKASAVVKIRMSYAQRKRRAREKSDR